MKRIKVLMIYIFLPLVICLGCNKKENADNSFDVPQSTDSVHSMLNIEPITIPKEEWTLDTICKATYINGKNLQVPCTIHDLGEGFNIKEINENDNFAYNEGLGRAAGCLTFNDEIVAFFSVENCSSIDAILDSPLIYLDFNNERLPFEIENSKFPISVNGIVVGDELETVNERLYFMDPESSDGSSEFYCLYKEIYNFRIACTCADGEVKAFTIWFHNR